MPNKPSKNFYIDLDGTAVIYDRSAYVGDDPLFMRKNAHYYRDLEPDRKMLEFIDTIHRQSRYTGDNIYILTSLPNNGAIFNEQFHDKISWVSRWLPYIPIDNILISVTSKRDAVEYIHNHTLSEYDILIDDYNKNLVEWRDAGGTAVKYCNGINTPESFNGSHIASTYDIDDMLLTINLAVNDTQCCPKPSLNNA